MKNIIIRSSAVVWSGLLFLSTWDRLLTTDEKEVSYLGTIEFVLIERW